MDGSGTIILKASMRLRRVRVPSRSHHVLHSVRRLAAATQRPTAHGVVAWKEGNPGEEIRKEMDTMKSYGRYFEKQHDMASDPDQRLLSRKLKHSCPLSIMYTSLINAIISGHCLC